MKFSPQTITLDLIEFIGTKLFIYCFTKFMVTPQRNYFKNQITISINNEINKVLSIYLTKCQKNTWNIQTRQIYSGKMNDNSSIYFIQDSIIIIIIIIKTTLKAR